jgi:hypothetical protein
MRLFALPNGLSERLEYWRDLLRLIFFRAAVYFHDCTLQRKLPVLRLVPSIAALLCLAQFSTARLRSSF